MGYMLDDGNIEWIKMHSLYVSEWSADDSSATITAVDILKYLDEKYYKGIYYEDGISLYDLAVLVLTDAGLNEDEYYIDSYMKKVYVHNPLPNGKKCLLMCWGAIRATSLTARLTVCVNGKEYCSGLTSSASYVPVFDSCIMTLPKGQNTIELKLSAQENTATAYIGRYHKLGFIVAEL